MGDARTFTLAQALQLDEIRRGVPEVVAGADHLQGCVRWVHPSEMHDVAVVLKGGELLLTTGTGLRGSESRQRRFVGDLARRGAAGLLLELGEVFRSVPRAPVAEARRLELPFIVLHRQVPFLDITEAVHRAILGGQAALVDGGERLQQHLIDLVLAGAGVAEVAQALSEAVANPLVISHDGEVVYSVADGELRARVGAEWELIERGLPDALEHHVSTLHVDGDPAWGRLYVLPLRRPLSPADRVAVSRALAPLALAFTRARESGLLQARERGDFLRALIDDDEQGEQLWLARAVELDFTRLQPWLMPVVVDRAVGESHLASSEWAALSRALRTELRANGTPAIVGTLGEAGQLALVVGMSSEEQRDATAAATARTISELIRHRARIEVVICVGRAAHSWSTLRAHLRRTVAALPAVRWSPRAPYVDVGVPSLLELVWVLQRHELFREFVAGRLQPLIEHDATRNGDLLHTLEVFCAHGGRKAATARALHLERQSLYKRLARMQAALGVDLDEEDTRLSLHLALRGRRLLDDAAARLLNGRG